MCALLGGFLSPGNRLHPKPDGTDLWSGDRPCVMGTFTSSLDPGPRARGDITRGSASSTG